MDLCWLKEAEIPVTSCVNAFTSAYFNVCSTIKEVQNQKLKTFCKWKCLWLKSHDKGAEADGFFSLTVVVVVTSSVTTFRVSTTEM